MKKCGWGALVFERSRKVLLSGHVPPYTLPCCHVIGYRFSVTGIAMVKVRFSLIVSFV